MCSIIVSITGREGRIGSCSAGHSSACLAARVLGNPRKGDLTGTSPDSGLSLGGKGDHVSWLEGCSPWNQVF